MDLVSEIIKKFFEKLSVDEDEKIIELFLINGNYLNYLTSKELKQIFSEANKKLIETISIILKVFWH